MTLLHRLRLTRNTSSLKCIGACPRQVPRFHLLRTVEVESCVVSRQSPFDERNVVAGLAPAKPRFQSPPPGPFIPTGMSLQLPGESLQPRSLTSAEQPLEKAHYWPLLPGELALTRQQEGFARLQPVQVGGDSKVEFHHQAIKIAGKAHSQRPVLPRLLELLP